MATRKVHSLSRKLTRGQRSLGLGPTNTCDADADQPFSARGPNNMMNRPMGRVQLLNLTFRGGMQASLPTESRKAATHIFWTCVL